MKRFLNNLVLVALSVLTFACCQKSDIAVSESDAETVTLTFASEKPMADDETKTEWTGGGIRWSSGDRISVAYTVEDKWQNAVGDAEEDARLYKSLALSDAADVAKFSVSAAFNGDAVGSHVFYGVYPAPETTSFAGAPSAVLSVPTVQCPEADSFDAKGDLLIGKSGIYDAFPYDEEISLYWNRVVAHAHITLKTISGFTAGETVNQIILTAQDGVNLVGQQKVNLITGEVVCDNTSSNVVTIDGRNLTPDASGNVTFWACILPAKVTSLNVAVITDKAAYTREIKSCDLDFKKNARNVLGINMASAVRQEIADESWSLVSPAKSLSAGTYVLIVKTDANNGALVSTNGTSSAPKFYTSGISINGTSLEGVTDDMMFDLSGTESSYVFTVTGQPAKYLYTTNNNNGVRVGGTSNTWKVTVHPSNPDAFLMQSTSTNRYLGVYNNQDWRCYEDYKINNFTNGKGSGEVYLYKKTSGFYLDKPADQPAISVTETLSLDAEESDGVINATCENVESVEVNAYSDSDFTVDCNWLDTEWNGTGVAYSVKENTGDERTAYVRLCARNTDGDEEIKVITVTQAAKSDESGPGDDSDQLVEVIATLSFADKSNRESFSSTRQVWSQNGITVTNNKANSTNNVADYFNPVRFYTASNLIVEAGGNEMLKIVFVCGESSYASELKKSMGNVSGAELSMSGSNVTVEFTTPVEILTISSLSAQVRMNSITVTYMAAGSVGGGGSQPNPDPEPEPEPDPEPNPTPDPDAPSSSTNPAVNQTWLELPGEVSASSYSVNTYYNGSTRNYTHLYDTNTYTSLWTAYPLNSSHMGSESRPGSWTYSPSIPESDQVNLKSHSYNDGYSRGHLIPNGSRNGIKAMQLQTFYVTNSVPQIQNNFNGGIWERLEDALQTIGGKEEIYIVTGVAFNKVGENKTIKYTTAKDDSKKVPVPNYFYKVVLKVEKSGATVTSASTIGFWFEHKTYGDTFDNYAESVDQIEKWTGFDFFVNLPDNLEDSAESNKSWTNFQSF